MMKGKIMKVGKIKYIIAGLLASVVLLVGAVLLVFIAAQGEEIWIEDPNLEAAIRDQINLPHGKIYSKHLKNLSILEARDNSISSLNGLEKLTSLVSLDLRGNKIVDVTPIASLKQLESLDMRDNQIRDISSLERLHKIEELNIRGNLISDITPLSELTLLRVLNMRDNLVKDISPLANLKQLQDLNIRNNQIVQIEGIEKLPQLNKRLYVMGNPISDYSPLYPLLGRTRDIDIDYIPPVFSHSAGFYENEFLLEITTPYEGATIYYTLDGSVPDPEQNAERTFQYTSPIRIYDRTGKPNNIANIPTTNVEHSLRGWEEPSDQIKKATVVRAIAHKKSGKITSVTSKTYFIDEKAHQLYTFPVVSILTDPKGLFDETIGIYVPGVFADENDPFRSGNFAQRGLEWERPVHIQFFEEDGVIGLTQNAGLRIHGNFSRSFPQKSLRLYSRSDYGENRFIYDFFPEKPIIDYNRLILRNSGNDWNMTMFRDAAMQSLLQHLDIDIQYARPSIVFINGEYWGIHNIRDRFDHHYLETHYGADRENFTVIDDTHIEGQLVVNSGDPTGRDHFIQLLEYIKENGVESTEHYEYIKDNIDIDNFALYYAIQIYNANTDWPHNNYKYWRYNGDSSQTDSYGLDGKWRWMVFDVDRSLGYVTYTQNMMEWTTSLLNPRTEEEWPNFLFRELLKNEEFQYHFINTMADQLNTTFESKRVINAIEDMQNRYMLEIEEHLYRWGNNVPLDRWYDRIEVMKEFAINRPNYVRNHILEHFQLDGIVNLTIETDFSKGTVKINNTLLEDVLGVENTINWDGQYFKGVPIELKAIPNEGYVFGGWGVGMVSDSKEISITTNESMKLSPVFVKEG